MFATVWVAVCRYCGSKILSKFMSQSDGLFCKSNLLAITGIYLDSRQSSSQRSIQRALTRKEKKSTFCLTWKINRNWVGGGGGSGKEGGRGRGSGAGTVRPSVGSVGNHGANILEYYYY